MNNKTIHRCATLLLSLLTAVACTSPPSAHRENGWYGIYDGRKDSIALRPVVTVKEFVGLRLYRDHLGRSVIAGASAATGCRHGPTLPARSRAGAWGLCSTTPS
uniref:hypothetical protein n=1 Tax=Prevotella sp. TaxID=59823 RepID=UPI003FEF8807